MANLTEESKWEEGIYQLEKTDRIVGGVDGISNKQAKQLANRTTYLKENTFDKIGKANGIASLDKDGRIPYSQLPESAVEFKGNWNAETNAPHLADGTGDLGDMYIVSVAGTQNLGSGEIDYLVGDRLIYNQNSVWEKLSGGSVRSVENQLPDTSGNISLLVADAKTKGLVKQSDLIFKLNKYLYSKNTSTFNSVIYANNMFVAVGASGSIVTSNDGVTWTKQTSPVTDKILYSVIYANNMFVAVGENGSIVTSNDGVTWTEQTSPVTNKILRSVIYANNMFVVVGDSTVLNFIIEFPDNYVKVNTNGDMTVPIIDELTVKTEQAQTTAEQAQASADEKQPYLGKTVAIVCPPNESQILNTEDLENLTNIILNETESDIKVNILIQSAPITTYEVLGVVRLWQENGLYKMDSSQVSSKITLILNANQIKITNSTTEEKYIVFIPMGFSRE